MVKTKGIMIQLIYLLLRQRKIDISIKEIGMGLSNLRGAIIQPGFYMI